MSEQPQAHVWHFRLGMTCCKLCGIVQRADGKNSPCKGKVKIGLRAGEKPKE